MFGSIFTLDPFNIVDLKLIENSLQEEESCVPGRCTLDHLVL